MGDDWAVTFGLDGYYGLNEPIIMRKSIVKDKSVEYSILVMNICNQSCESKYWNLSNQLFKSATSIGANIVEALDAESQADFIHKMAISLKECSESLYWLELMSITSPQINSQISQALRLGLEIQAMLRSIIITAKSNRKK